MSLPTYEEDNKEEEYEEEEEEEDGEVRYRDKSLYSLNGTYGRMVTMCGRGLDRDGEGNGEGSATTWTRSMSKKSSSSSSSSSFLFKKRYYAFLRDGKYVSNAFNGT